MIWRATTLSLVFSFCCFAVTVRAQEVIPGITVASVSDIPTPPDGEARAYYESATGDIFLTINGEVLTFAVDDESLFELDNANHETPIGHLVAEFNLGVLRFDGIPNGTFNIGRLLPADVAIRSADQFATVYPTAILRSNAPFTDPVFSRLGVIAIPEPGSGTLWVIAAVGWLGRRRR